MKINGGCPKFVQFHQVNNAEMHQKSLVETILRLTPVLTNIVEQGIEEGSFHTPYPQETVEFLLVSHNFYLMKEYLSGN